MSNFKEFNVNSWVKVKLTEVGLQELQRQKEALRDSLSHIKNLPVYDVKVDSEGYYTCQMWSLMESLGHLCRLGCEPPFDTTILLETKGG